jgi:ubiquinone/menaquinone biosynthesis C-methylase UbiE
MADPAHIYTESEQVLAEAGLAKQLTEASTEERERLYSSVYDQIYEMHLSRAPDTLEFGATLRLLPILLRLSSPGNKVLEIGCGTGLLATELAKAGRHVVGIDVSNVALERARRRAGDTARVAFQHVEGVKLPQADASFDFAYSIDVFEHLHEADAPTHLAEVRRVLKPGGRYWFLTPSRLGSLAATQRFKVEVEVDADVHLKEWTYGELAVVLRGAGFQSAAVPIIDKRYVRRARVHSPLHVPFLPVGLYAALERMPMALRRRWVVRAAGIGRCSVVASRAS